MNFIGVDFAPFNALTICCIWTESTVKPSVILRLGLSSSYKIKPTLLILLFGIYNGVERMRNKAEKKQKRLHNMIKII